MLFAALIFPGWNWLWPALVVAGGALLLASWSYRRSPPGPARWLCLFLRGIGLSVLAFCLLEPLWAGQRARPGANLFTLVADNSQSLQIRNAGESRSRGDQLRDLLNPQRGRWQSALEEHFEVRRYRFDSRLEATKDFSELAFDGRASALTSALRALAERYRGRPLAGVLLLTDGNATDAHGASPDVAGLPPVYPVVLGNPDRVTDIAVRQVQVNQTDFEDAPVSVQADVSATGYRGAPVVTQLLDRSGRLVAEQTLRPRNENDTLAFRFQFRPETPGLSFYQLRARAKSEAGPQNPPGRSAEATLANNHTVVVVNRGRGPYRILYVAGRPNWEFKFLNRAVQADDQLQLAALIRVAKREPKFDFLGRPGEMSNPLFRGFGNQSREEVERYDQPVLKPLLPPDSDPAELAAGFPKTAEDLYRYHAVILDDVEADFFTADQALQLQKFVSERGGGFLMLGGMESFREGRYQRTPIGDMLPVYLDREDDANPPGLLRLNLTREGWLQTWARLRDTEADEKARLRDMPPFQVLNRVRDIKPGASTIATVADEAGKTYPALVVQRFGRGRTAALTVGDVWHWGLRDADAHRDMDKAWRQLMRWLVTDVPNRVDLAVEPEPGNGQGAMLLQTRVRDPQYQALDNAEVTLEIQPLMSEPASGTGTNVLRLRAEASAKEPGLYECSYVPRATGGYQVTACVTNAAGLSVGRAEAGWSTDLAAEEFRSLTPNVPLLETLARKTGGEIVRADRLEEFVRTLPQRQAPVMEAWSYPVWHTPAMFAVALACFVAEWGIRRTRGMP